jgi:hypothetical protein
VIGAFVSIDRSQTARARHLDAPDGADVRVVTRAEEPAAAIEPDIQIAGDPEACRSTSLVGQPIGVPSYLVLTEAGNTTAVEWSIDGRALGRSATAPFVPRDASGTAVAVPLDLAPGAHEVSAQVTDAEGESGALFGQFTVPASDAGAVVTEGVEVVAADGTRRLGDWDILHGTVAFRSLSAIGALKLDGAPLDEGTPINIDGLAPGRHEIVGSRPFAAPVTFVSTGGRPSPASCGTVDIADYGAVGDVVADTAARCGGRRRNGRRG